MAKRQKIDQMQLLEAHEDDSNCSDVENCDEKESETSESSSDEEDVDVRSDIDIDNNSSGWETTRKFQFEWTCMGGYTGTRETFCATPGPSNGAENIRDIVECFQLFFDEDLIRKIVQETNKHANHYYADKVSTPKVSRTVPWIPVTENEIYIVLGLFMLMGVVQKPTVKLYFTKKRLISTPGFGDVISRDRFEKICQFIHYADNEEKQNFQGPQKLFKIFNIAMDLNAKFQKYYVLEQNIAIDESLPSWKNQFSFKQYLPLKSAKLGIKMYELCESTSGYLWAFTVYAGKETTAQSNSVTINTPKTAAIVLNLVEPLLYKGYTLWMGSFFNSPDLSLFLKMHQTDCVGILEEDRKNVPDVIRDKTLENGEIIAQHAGPITVMKWHDKKSITMISTFHAGEVIKVRKKGKETVKPSCIVEYNQHMRGVDVKDQMLGVFLIERKRLNKWYHKLFKRLLNTAILNSFIIYKRNTTAKITHLEFRIALVEAIFIKFRAYENRKITVAFSNDLRRLHERHFLRRIESTGAKKWPQKRCVVCKKHGKKKDTTYCCPKCNVGLCLDKCFETFHTKVDY